MIKHNTYFDGQVQSLGFKQDEDDATIGVVEPGDYNFGVAERPETIKVISGQLIINGSLRVASVAAKDSIYEIKSGEAIEISATLTAAYLCIYG